MLYSERALLEARSVAVGCAARGIWPGQARAACTLRRSLVSARVFFAICQKHRSTQQATSLSATTTTATLRQHVMCYNFGLLTALVNLRGTTDLLPCDLFELWRVGVLLLSSCMSLRPTTACLVNCGVIGELLLHSCMSRCQHADPFAFGLIQHLVSQANMLKNVA